MAYPLVVGSQYTFLGRGIEPMYHSRDMVILLVLLKIRQKSPLDF